MVRKHTGEALDREAAVMRTLARVIGGLHDFGLAELRARYLEVFHAEARSKNLPFLRKRIAFRLQEQLEGGLSEAAKQRIQKLAPLEGKGKTHATARQRTAPVSNCASEASIHSQGRSCIPLLPMYHTGQGREAGLSNASAARGSH